MNLQVVVPYPNYHSKNDACCTVALYPKKERVGAATLNAYFSLLPPFWSLSVACLRRLRTSVPAAVVRLGSWESVPAPMLYPLPWRSWGGYLGGCSKFWRGTQSRYLGRTISGAEFCHISAGSARECGSSAPQTMMPRCVKFKIYCSNLL